MPIVILAKFLVINAHHVPPTLTFTQINVFYVKQHAKPAQKAIIQMLV